MLGEPLDESIEHSGFADMSDISGRNKFPFYFDKA